MTSDGRSPGGSGAGNGGQPASVDRRSIWRVGPESTWTTILPVAFIIVSLLSLVIIPLVVSSHTAEMRREIGTIADPARTAANRIQVNLASELDKIIAWQVTGQEQYRGEYEKLLAEQRASRAALVRLAPLLDETIDDKLFELVQEIDRWHASVRSGELLTRTMPQEVFLARLYERHPPYEKALAVAIELEVSIQEAIDDRIAKIRDAERLNLWLTLILTLLALTSALLVAGLGRQMRLLAREAMRRRHEAEREAADAKSARQLAEREERRAAFLASAGQELASSLDYQQTISQLARIVTSNLAEYCVVDIIDADAVPRRAAVARRRSSGEATLARQSPRRIEGIPEAIVRILQEKEAKLIGASSPIVAHFSDGDAAPGYGAIIVAPLVSRGEVLGLVAASPREDRPFTRDDVFLLGELTRHASLAVDNARLYHESLQAVRTREEVLAIVSHDLRNPLNAVKLGASLLKMSETITDEDREQLDIIDLSANRMTRLIADLLDVTRLEGGKQLPIEPAPIEVAGVLHETHEIFKSQALAEGVTLDYEQRDGVTVMFADRHRIIQALSNLIGNSLKFTPPGGSITFSAELRGEDVLFTVADTGPGIPSENLGKIFNPYWQAKRAERMGAGLGLAITKGVVEAHGGTIWVESEPGNGARFLFTIPRRVTDRVSEASSAFST